MNARVHATPQLANPLGRTTAHSGGLGSNTMKEARHTSCGGENIQRCSGTRSNRAPGTRRMARRGAAKAPSTSLEDSFWVAGNCRRTSYTLRDGRRFPCSPAVKLAMPWIASALPPVACGCNRSYAAGVQLSERESGREAQSERAICEGEIELRGTAAAEKGGLHMGRDGTAGVFVSATRWRKCLGRYRFSRALFVHVRLATLQGPHDQR
jgi:hypothetical protein